MRSFTSIFILLILGIIFSVKRTFAQSGSDVVTLNIRLLPIQTIVVNPSQKNTDLQYVTKEDYDNGVTLTLTDHLSVSSTGGFQINVLSSNVNFTRAGSDDIIPVSDVVVSAESGSDNSLSNEFSKVALSTNPESLIVSDNGGRDLKYDVTYDNTAGSSDKYINKTSGQSNLEVVYKTNITYTITSK